MTDESMQYATFSESEAQEIIDTLGVSVCVACGKPITVKTLGGAMLVDGHVLACHNNVLCFMAFMDQTER